MAHPAGLYFVCIVKYTVKVDRFQQGTQGFEPYVINIGGPAEVWENSAAASAFPSRLVRRLVPS
jgi:hypothetical protein